jgi:hypothetical protein
MMDASLWPLTDFTSATASSSAKSVTATGIAAAETLRTDVSLFTVDSMLDAESSSIASIAVEVAVSVIDLTHVQDGSLTQQGLNSQKLWPQKSLRPRGLPVARANV